MSDASNKPPVVVGIGASAGGVQALQTFFDALAGNDTGAAFVVVVHLDPDGAQRAGRISWPLAPGCR